MWTILSVVALIVTGAVTYLILERREEHRRLEDTKKVNKALWTELIKRTVNPNENPKLSLDELKKLKDLDHETLTKKVLERWKQ